MKKIVLFIVVFLLYGGLQSQTKPTTYRIIAGAFEIKQNALVFSGQLKNQGIDCHIFYNKATSFYLVSVFSTSSQREAILKLQEYTEQGLISDNSWYYTGIASPVSVTDFGSQTNNTGITQQNDYYDNQQDYQNEGTTNGNETTATNSNRNWDFRLFDAVQSGDVREAQNALNHHADIQFRLVNNMNLLHLACKNKKVRMAEFLIKQNIEVNAQNNDGLTPLMVAVFYQQYDICKLLLEHGADPNIADVDGVVPLDIAFFQKQEDISKLLISHGAKSEKFSSD